MRIWGSCIGLSMLLNVSWLLMSCSCWHSILLCSRGRCCSHQRSLIKISPNYLKRLIYNLRGLRRSILSPTCIASLIFRSIVARCWMVYIRPLWWLSWLLCSRPLISWLLNRRVSLLCLASTSSGLSFMAGTTYILMTMCLMFLTVRHVLMLVTTSMRVLLLLLLAMVMSAFILMVGALLLLLLLTWIINYLSIRIIGIILMLGGRPLLSGCYLYRLGNCCAYLIWLSHLRLSLDRIVLVCCRIIVCHSHWLLGFTT